MKIVHIIQIIAAIAAVGGVFGFLAWIAVLAIKDMPIVGYCYSAIVLGVFLFIVSLFFKKSEPDNK